MTESPGTPEPDAAPIVAAVPVKPFGVAKQRLETVLDARARERLGKEMAHRTVRLATIAGARTVVVTGHSGVAAWAAGLGIGTIEELAPNLDGAAAAAASYADSVRSPWLFIHADLPLLEAGDVEAAIRALHTDRAVLAPAHDGGTNILGAAGPGFPFAYGRGSFHRHLRSAMDMNPVIVSTPGTAVDIDTPRDLELAAALPAGKWLAEFLARPPG